ncbi:TonB-dependent receptor [Sphingobacterium suaedae]|uniref:TonB-dependent receptor n=1 Tax=Sphingobacterium suaedae TaxID=1686402 RepID=A0ABW5KFI0_9SPHI
MKIFLLNCFFVLCVYPVIAQHRELSGIVKDSLTRVPIAYASVGLVDSGNHVVDGMMTDSVGGFRFTAMQKGTYRLLVKSIGYKQKWILVDLREYGRTGQNDILLVPANRELESVEVTADGRQQRHAGDRQVYRADQYKNAVGGTALDIVKNLPAASVDANGAISMRGNSGIMVLINGKPSFLDAATLLTQIAANDVMEVEYITNPSAQFDPDGKGGMINLKTRKRSMDGLAWTLNLQGGLPSIDDYSNAKRQQRYGGDVAFQYVKDKLELNASANFLRNDNAGFRVGDVHTVIGDRQTFFPSAGERSFDKYSYGVRVNAGYATHEKHEWNIGLLASRRYQDRIADIYYQNRTIQPSTGRELSAVDYFNPNLQNKQGEFYLADFSYRYKMNKTHALQFGAIYEYAHIYGSTNNRNVERGDTVQWTQNTYENPLQGFRLSLQHTWKLKNMELQSGYQLRHDRQRGDFQYAESTKGQQQVIVPEFTGKLRASNLVHALFSQYNQTIHNLQVAVGLRYEYYQRDVLLVNDGQKFPYAIHQLYPSLSLMKPLGRGWDWKFAAARRVQRNNNFELNPIPEREHSETLEQGDPELLPEFITNVETGIVKKLPSGSVFFNAYYQHSRNPIQRVNSVYADTILHRVFTNADFAERWGMEVGGNLKIGSWLQIQLGANVYDYTVSGQVLSYSGNRRNNQWVYSINSGIQTNWPKAWSMGVQLNYLSDRPTVQGIDSRFVTPHLNLSKSFYNGALTAQLQWQYMELGKWGVNEQRITTFADDFYTTTNYIYEKNVLLLNLNLNLQKIKNVLKLPKSEFGEKEF